jgi:fumarylacetoacetase
MSMHASIDFTHDPQRTSWVASANVEGADFPLQNLPFGRFRAAGGDWRLGVAIGDEVLDLRAAADVLTLHPALALDTLNDFMALGADARRETRKLLSQALASGSTHEQALRGCLVPQRDVELGLPCRIGDYTDFYTGIHHAVAVGRLFRPDNPLLPNYKWVPIGYHGRASSILPSGTPFRRPLGQTAGEGAPRFGPTQRLDHELELGVLVGAGNRLGEPMSMAQAEDDWFGLVLLNDWSARDVQAWEYQPLGPFLSKNFATTISAWVVTAEALAPFRAPFVRPEGDPQPLPHLDSPAHRERGTIELALEVWAQGAAMAAPQLVSRSNFRHAYWTVAQMLAHHASNGCNLQPGDLLGTGTLSGPVIAESGSLLELTQGGRQPIALGGEPRTWWLDGDAVILRAHAEREGFRRIGFGDCAATVLPAAAAPAA